MSLIDATCEIIEKAEQSAMRSCIKKMGKYCEAYGGVNCNKCPKLKEGLKRREENRKREDKLTIKEINLGGTRVMRLSNFPSNAFVIEIGLRYKDKPDRPDIFETERQIFLNKKEKNTLPELFAK